MVDLDGPGPVPPSLVTCELEGGHKVSVVSHSSMEPTKVDGFQAPGSFSQTIYYSVETEVRADLYLLLNIEEYRTIKMICR